jgi:hypothetical protein
MEVLKDADGHPSEQWFLVYDKTTNEATAS